MFAATAYLDPQHRTRTGHVPGLISRVLAPRAKDGIINSEGLAAFLRNGGEQPWAGIDINPETALHISAYFAGVRMISEDIGKLEWPVFTKAADDSRQRANSSPYWSLLHDDPNGWMDSGQFRELLTGHAVNRGNGYALQNIVGGRVRELLPLKPQAVTPEQHDDFGIVYHVRMANGTVKDFPPSVMFHIRGFSTDGLIGLSVPTLARQGLATARAQERHTATVFGNGVHVSGVYTHPGELSDRAYERVKADIDDLKREGANGALILEEGMGWSQTGLSNVDAQFLESRKFQVTEVARWLRIPPHKLADLERATFTNIEHQGLEYLNETIYTWGQRWDRAAKRQVIGRGRPEYAETNYDVLLRTTALERTQVYRTMAGRPWATPNELRRFDNMPPITDDPTMDQVFLPKNLDGGSTAGADPGRNV